MPPPPSRPFDPGCLHWGRERKVLAETLRIALPSNTSLDEHEAAGLLATAVRDALEALPNIAARGQVRVHGSLVDTTAADAGGGGDATATYELRITFSGTRVGGDVPQLTLDASGVSAPGGALTAARVVTAQDGSDIRGRLVLTWDDSESYPNAATLAGARAPPWSSADLSACAADELDSAALAPQGPRMIFVDMANVEPAVVEDAVLRAVFACAPAPVPLWVANSSALGVRFGAFDWRTWPSAANFTAGLAPPPCIEAPPLPWDEGQFGGDVGGCGGGGSMWRPPIYARPAVRVEVATMIGGGPDLELTVYFLRGVRSRGDVAPLRLSVLGTTLALVSPTTFVANVGVGVAVEEVIKGEFVDPSSVWSFSMPFLTFPGGEVSYSAPLGPFPWCADPLAVKAAIDALDASVGAIGLVNVTRARSGAGGDGTSVAPAPAPLSANGSAVATSDTSGFWRGQYQWNVSFLSQAENVPPIVARQAGPITLVGGLGAGVGGVGRADAAKVQNGSAEVPTSEVQLIDCVCAVGPPGPRPPPPAASRTPSSWPSVGVSFSVSASASPTASNSSSLSPFATRSASASATSSASASRSASPTSSASASPSSSASDSTSFTPSSSASASVSGSPSTSPWPSAFPSASPSRLPSANPGGCGDPAAHSIVLRFRGALTQPIPFSATAADVRAALAALPSVPDVAVSMYRRADGGAAPGAPLQLCDAFGVTTAITFSHNPGPQEPLEVARSGLPPAATLALLRAPAVGRFGGRARVGTHLLLPCSGRGSCDDAGTCSCFGDGTISQWQASDGGAWPDAAPRGPQDASKPAAKMVANCGAPVPTAPVSRCPGVVAALAGSTTELAPGVKLVVLLGGGSEGECSLTGTCSGAPLWRCSCDPGKSGPACLQDVSKCGAAPAWFDVPSRNGGGYGGVADGPPGTGFAALPVTAHRPKLCAARGECSAGSCSCFGRWAGRGCELSPCPGGERLAPNPAAGVAALFALSDLDYRRASATTDCSNAMPCVTQAELALNRVNGSGAVAVLPTPALLGAGAAAQALAAAGARAALAPADGAGAAADAPLLLDLVLRPGTRADFLAEGGEGGAGAALAALVAARLQLLRPAVLLSAALESPGGAARSFSLLLPANHAAATATAERATSAAAVASGTGAGAPLAAADAVAALPLWNASEVGRLEALGFPADFAQLTPPPNDWLAVRFLLLPRALDAAAAAAAAAAGEAPLARTLTARLDAALNASARLAAQEAANASAAAADAFLAAANVAAAEGNSTLLELWLESVGDPYADPFPAPQEQYGGALRAAPTGEPPGSLLGDVAALWGELLGGLGPADGVAASGAYIFSAPPPSAAAAAGLGDAAAALLDAAAAATPPGGLLYTAWDAHMIRGCACGAYALRAGGAHALNFAWPTAAYDCGAFACPAGPDPQDAARAARAPRDVQRVVCTASSGRVRFGMRGVWGAWLRADAGVADADTSLDDLADSGLNFEAALRQLNTSLPFFVALDTRGERVERERDARGRVAGVAREGGGARRVCDGRAFFVIFLGAISAPDAIEGQLDETMAAEGGALTIDVVQRADDDTRFECNRRGACNRNSGACECYGGYGAEDQTGSCSARNNFFGLIRELPPVHPGRGSATANASLPASFP